MMLNIVVIHPDTTFVQTLKNVILQEPDWFLLRHEANFESFHQSFPKRARIDIAIIHSNEIERIQDLKSLSSQILLIVLCDMEVQADAMRAFYNGAVAYGPTMNFQESIVYYLKIIIAGGSYISPSIARHIIDFLTIPSHRKKNNRYLLTPKEVEVIHLISADNTYDEVATALGITKNGVRFHIKNIYIKLNVKNRLEAVRKWINQF
jgi:DNA-binding NarL/FixJ family response regulator